MKGFLVVFVTVLAMTWLATRATLAKAHQSGDTWVFPVIRPVQWIYGCWLALGLAGALFGAVGPQGDRKVPAVCGVLFICFAAVTWPKAIYVSPTGVRQRGWLGGWRTEPWSQISEVKEKPDHSIVVRGPKDKIVFSPYHADPQRFLSEVCRHRDRC